MAKARWQVLATAIKKSKLDHDFVDPIPHGLVRFPSFGLLSAQNLSGQDEDEHRQWLLITAPNYPRIRLKISHLKPKFTSKDLIGFNNTGNVCIWPSEECLSIYLLEHPDLLCDQSVLELGGGMTALAGLIIAQMTQPREVLLTDGNPTSVENLQTILRSNPDLKATAQVLQWNQVDKELRDRFDLVICSDCLFFDEYRSDLARCIYLTLKPGGQALVLAPNRHGTFEKFRAISADIFEHVEVVRDSYSERVVDRQCILRKDKQFNEDIHLPLMLKLTKGRGKSVGILKSLL